MLFKGKNHFEIFSLPATYQVNLSDLSDRYRGLQSQLHPDRVAGGTEQEKFQAIQLTSLLNEAFETLKSPRRRAAYLLELAGIQLDRVDQAHLSPQLLLEQMELREELEEISRDESGLAQLESLRSRIDSRLEESELKFAAAMEEGDLQVARSVYFEMQYCAKLVAEIKTLEEDLLGY